MQEQEQEYTNKELYNIFINLGEEANFIDIWDDNLGEFILFITDYTEQLKTILIKKYYTELTNKEFTSKTIIYPDYYDRLNVINNMDYLVSFYNWSYKSRLTPSGMKKYKRMLMDVYDCFIDRVYFINE